MDITYADASGKDIGTIKKCEIDIEYGTDANAKNDFVITTELKQNVLERNYRVYIEGSEYGGILDAAEIDTTGNTNTIAWSGRSWHGILNSKVIENVYASGEANAVIGEIIETIGLSDLFEAATEQTDIYIDYDIRCMTGYDAINQMLLDANAKMVITVNNYGKAVIEAKEIVDYSEVETFKASSNTFTIKKVYNKINHVLCTDGIRQIHLFCDEDGSIQQYSEIEEPLEDADYIIDESQKVLDGLLENAKICRCEETTETNYKHVIKQPADWKRKYDTYYELIINEDGESSYEKVEASTTRKYTLLSSKPSDWSTDFDDYYTRSTELDENGQYTYSAVSGDTTYTYIQQKKKPVDWKYNYSQYYRKRSDGTGQTEWVGAEGIDKSKYVLQKTKPTGWAQDYTQYYYKKLYSAERKYTNPKKKSKASQEAELKTTLKNKYADYKYNSIKRKTKDGTYGSFTIYYYRTSMYAKVESASSKKSVAPAWKKNKYYTKKTITNAPAWSNAYHTRKVTGTVAPGFQTNVYYSCAETNKAPHFTGTIYKEVYDHYAGLIEEGLKILENKENEDTITINFDSNEEAYDVGDVVGCVEEHTGMEVWQRISAKIIKIKDNIQDIEYRIGG